MKNIAIIILLLVSTGFSQPCTDYKCDSLVVRKMLDLNNLQSVRVDSVSEKVGDRILSIIMTNLGIDTIIPEIANLSGLLYINLDRNRIRSIPAEFENLNKLGELSIKNNLLTELPLPILLSKVKWNRLHVALLDSNLINTVYFPDSIINKINFATLSLTGNRICKELDDATTNALRNCGVSMWGNYVSNQICGSVSLKHNKKRQNQIKLSNNNAIIHYDLRGRIINNCDKNRKIQVQIIKQGASLHKVVNRDR